MGPRFIRWGLRFGALCTGFLGAGAAQAEPILAPDPVVDALAVSYERQQDTFARLESGQNLDAFIKPDQQTIVNGFFAQTAQDFATFAGKHPFDVVDHFDEHGDMGNFSGIASVGLAARLMVARRDGKPADEITRARDACIAAARTWHVFASIAGPGLVARGVRRTMPLAGQPALPGVVPPVVPLKDGAGKPLPASKTDTWRAPVAAGFDGWMWIDNTSKDQVAGYALGVLWLWDALRADSAAPKDVVTALADDLKRFATSLMTVVPELGVDLVVRDADGRLTSFGDLNSRLLSGTSGFALPADSSLQNGFNAALALAIVRAAVRMTGDPTLTKYYVDELVTHRQYPRYATETATLLYQGEQTNFSNVNMLAIALATLGRIETDPGIRKQFSALVDKFWDPGDSRAAVHAKQPWFDVIVAGFGAAPRTEVPMRMRDSLAGYPAVPTMQRDRINCDANEIAAKSCIAVDGTTVLTLSSKAGRGGSVVATLPVPESVRPDTDFAWRSDPFGVNDTASTRLNPRGDWLAAYWLGRLLDRDPSKNVLAPDGTPIAPVAKPDAGADAGAAAMDPNGAGPGGSSSGGDGSSGGCGCTVTAEGASVPALASLAALFVALAARRRRVRS